MKKVVINMSREAKWENWHKFAKINSILLMVVTPVLAWLQTVFPLSTIPWTALDDHEAMASIPLILVFALVALYLLFILRPVWIKRIDRRTHLFFFFCVVMAIFLTWAGCLVILQFVVVGFLSETPIWRAPVPE